MHTKDSPVRISTRTFAVTFIIYFQNGKVFTIGFLGDKLGFILCYLIFAVSSEFNDCEHSFMDRHLIIYLSLEYCDHVKLVDIFR